MAEKGIDSYMRRGRNTEQPRESGLLHPHAYLWVIENRFNGNATEKLNKQFWDACKAWVHYCTTNGCRQGIDSGYVALGKDKKNNRIIRPWS